MENYEHINKSANQKQENQSKTAFQESYDGILPVLFTIKD
jgi:hypothetical protein